jgi:ribulose-phosphate 3-epimerase
MDRAADNGLDFGLVVNPGTPFSAIADYVDRCNVVVIMSVEPGYGGQTFISDVLRKVATAREFVENYSLDADIEVDGGVTLDNAGEVIAAGATVLVAGTAVFRADDPPAAINALRRAAETR